MAVNTNLEVPQGSTWILAFECEDPTDPSPDFTGWRVKFIAKKQLSDVNADALFNIEVTPDPVSGSAQHTFTDEDTTDFDAGTYIYQGIAIDADGNVGKSQLATLVVIDTAYKGAIT